MISTFFSYIIHALKGERNTEIMQIKKALLRTLKPIKWYMENT